LKIAVVSSGLGHVARGIETWADDLAAALYKRGVDVTLFKGGRIVMRLRKILLFRRPIKKSVIHRLA
jgi:hypothetical protein